MAKDGREPFVLYEGIDMVTLPVSDLAAASAPFERLGLVVTPAQVNPSTRFAIRKIPIGGTDNLFCVEILSVATPADAETENGKRLLARADNGLAMLMLRVSDLSAALAELAERGVQPRSQVSGIFDGEKQYDVALLQPMEDAATGVGLIQYSKSQQQRHAGYASLGQHATPLKRLDHLAAVAPDLERSCKFWDEVLGVPTVGEVISPTVVVRQLKIGDAMFELLGPATPDSPIRQRPPGLNSMFSVEVPDLDATIAHATVAGFEVADRRVGTLPGTIVATIPGAQTSGLNVQLLQYV
jgi:catechol 2,3-dioxygenase-like lactoylglutathione lyase family enzyme